MPIKKDPWHGVMVSSIHPLTWLSYAEERGLSVQAIVQEVGLEPEAATSFSSGISLLKSNNLVLTIAKQLDDYGIGTEIGWRMPPTAYGSFGQAILSSRNAQDALELQARYGPIMTSGALQISHRIDHTTCSISISTPSELKEPLRHIALETAVATIYRTLTMLMPASAQEIIVFFDTPEPAWGMRIRAHLNEVRFDMQYVQLQFPVCYLETPLAMSSIAALKQAIFQCEKEEIAFNTQSQILQKVRGMLGLDASGFPSEAWMSEKLNMSCRNLRRRLADEGASYSDLVSDARHRDSIRLLENAKLSISQIAELLGYSDAGNFSRSFRKWADMSPSDYRARFDESIQNIS